MAQSDLSTLPPATSRPAQEAPAGKRGRRPGSKAKVRAELPADAFMISAVPVEERGTVRRKRVERSKQQLAIDSKVLDVWREWVATGRQTDWLKMPVKYWTIEKRFAEDAQFYLDKGARLHGKKLVIGDILPAEDAPGKVRIPFCVIDRVERDNSPSDESDQGSGE